MQVVVLDCESGKSGDCKVEEDQLQVTEERYRKKSFFDMRSLSGSTNQLFTHSNSVMNVQEEEEDWVETWRQVGKALGRISFGLSSFRFFSRLLSCSPTVLP